jgi:carbon storage regulator
MLIIRRKRNERIVLSGGIEILVAELKGGHASIGIQAPPHVQVVRGELLTPAEVERLQCPPEVQAMP